MENPKDNILGRTEDIPATMRVESSTLEPITITDTHARFVFENKGILSRDTVLQFQLTQSGTESVFLPIGCGIYSLIKRATLRVGAKRITEISDLAFYRTMTHSYNTPSYRANYLRFMKGINNTLVPTQVNASTASAAQVDGGKLQPTGVDVAINQLRPEVSDLPKTMALTQSADTTPCWSIYLRELFPILDSIELPLFLMNEEVAVDLEFNQQTTGVDGIVKGTGTIACSEASGANPPVLQNPTISLVKDSCLMFVDTIYYANERMEDIDRKLDATKGMSLKYTDVINQVSSMGQNAAMAAGTLKNSPVVHQIPLSGYAVKNIFWCYNAADRTSLKTGGNVTLSPRFYNPFYGKYALMSPPKSSQWDLRVNDLLHFPEPISNPALKANEARQVYNSPVYLHNALYSRDTFTAKTADFKNQADAMPFSSSVLDIADGGTYRLYGGLDAQELAGNQHFAAVNLSTMPGDANDDSIYINQKPIEVIHRAFEVNDETNFRYNALYFSEVVKNFALKNGNVMLFQGPSVVMAQ